MQAHVAADVVWDSAGGQCKGEEGEGGAMSPRYWPWGAKCSGHGQEQTEGVRARARALTRAERMLQLEQPVGAHAGMTSPKKQRRVRAVAWVSLMPGGLKEDYSTSHAFNDDNHCDLTTMAVQEGIGDQKLVLCLRGSPAAAEEAMSEDPADRQLGGTEREGPALDMNRAERQKHQGRIAFKLVWAPPDFSQFVLVDDEGRELRRGRPTGSLPPARARQGNFELVAGGKYALAAEALAGEKMHDGSVDLADG
ncbi:unnamed protein product [Prorocentrum cordatum]|uniref:Uncharacterized protein n=1 Tax=Prorocentrum cordatum TaxID=2364126 RepID=A0ABN9T1P5_9DINO|nr:unnamed protein product [Polarella glacialis]